MPKHGKRYRALLEKYDPDAEYPVSEACRLVTEVLPSAKFDETVEAHLRLGVDPRKADQMVRGTVVLPHGTGKKVRVLVLTRDPELEAKAKEAGADMVGFAEYIEKIKQGWLEFDAVVATPDAMPEVGKLGRILGPRGLMPSPKTGTVTREVDVVVRELKAGRVEFRVDKGGNIHAPLGKVSFGPQKIEENFLRFVDAVVKAKPQAFKGTYIKSAYLTTTMGPSVKVNLQDLYAKLRELEE